MTTMNSINYQAFNSLEPSKQQNYDFLSFTAPLDIVAPSPDLFETELDLNLEGLDDSQIPFFTVDSNDAFSQLRSGNPTCGPPSTFTISSESTYESTPSAYSASYYNNYTPSAYATSAYSLEFNEVDLRRIDLNTFADSFGPSIAVDTVDPTTFNDSPSPSSTSTHALSAYEVVEEYEKYIPRGSSDYSPSNREADIFSHQPHTHKAAPPAGSATKPSRRVSSTSDAGRPVDPRRKFKCTVCCHAFDRRWNLSQHMLTHEPNRPKPHVCSHRECGRSFSRKHDLTRHLISVHRETPFVGNASAKKAEIGVGRRARSWCDSCGLAHFGKESSCECHDDTK